MFTRAFIVTKYDVTPFLPLSSISQLLKYLNQLRRGYNWNFRRHYTATATVPIKGPPLFDSLGIGEFSSSRHSM